MQNPFKSARTTARRAVSRLATRGLHREPNLEDVLHEFHRFCVEMDQPRVLELGVRRAYADRSTRHDDWVPHASEYIGTDIEDGIDVDVVADVHTLSKTFGEEQFDAIISCSTFEHFKYPHLAAHEIMKTLRVGGALFVQTHQSFPLHAHPYDYFRYSTEALAGLFGTKMGFRVTLTGYQFRTRVMPRVDVDIATGEAYLNACLVGVKEAPTPSEFVYEL
jgi:SAM-dependent methyltransferase